MVILFLLRRRPVTHPSSQEGQSGDDPLLGDALEDPGCSVQAAHAGSQGGDVEAQQKEEAHQGDLEEEGKQTEAGRGWGGAEGSQQRRPVQFRYCRPLVKTMKTPPMFEFTISLNGLAKANFILFYLKLCVCIKDRK